MMNQAAADRKTYWGRFEPMKSTGASAIAPPNAIPCGGSASVAKSICTARSAFRTIVVSGDGESGTNIPKTTAPAIVTDSICTSQFAAPKMFANWMAKYRASGSFATCWTLILPRCCERTSFQLARDAGR
jgi:hypothetical protein